MRAGVGLMAFGPARIATPGSVCRGGLADTATTIERTLHDLARCRSALASAGVPLAATYLEGAADALAYAHDALLRAAPSMESGPDARLAVGLRGLALSADDGSAYAEFVAPCEIPPPALAGRSLGADLSAHGPIASALRRDEVAAALMAAALSHPDWIHPETGEVFTGDAVASHVVVATVAGRTSFPRWTRRRQPRAVLRR